MASEVDAHTIWSNARIATMDARLPAAFGLIEDGALVTAGSSIAWVGARADMPRGFSTAATCLHDLGGRLVTPGFVDCHTHLVYAGDRLQDFELRIGGAHYDEIARAGGGILSTVRATRAATAATLEAASEKRLLALA